MSSAPNPGERGRFSSTRKTAAVLRLLRGEDLELVSRELGVTAATRSSPHHPAGVMKRSLSFSCPRPNTHPSAA
jgi:hypothetical protein